MSSLTSIRHYFSAFIELFYPRICPTCSGHLHHQEFVVCTSCLITLPITNFYKLEQNPLGKKFWGRLNLAYIDSLLFLEKASKTQTLLYLLKYHKRQDIGVFLAEQMIKRYGNHLLPSQIQAIITIPLHPLKQKSRGFNQCHSFAKKLSQAWKTPFYPMAIIRKTNNKSQTKNNRVDRWENVVNIFEIAEKGKLEGKHILLIDDVITTGATLEACGLKILELKNAKLSILTMACKV